MMLLAFSHVFSYIFLFLAFYFFELQPDVLPLAMSYPFCCFYRLAIILLLFTNTFYFFQHVASFNFQQAFVTFSFQLTFSYFSIQLHLAFTQIFASVSFQSTFCYFTIYHKCKYICLSFDIFRFQLTFLLCLANRHIVVALVNQLPLCYFELLPSLLLILAFSQPIANLEFSYCFSNLNFQLAFMLLIADLHLFATFIIQLPFCYIELLAC